MNTLYITTSGKILIDDSGSPHSVESSRGAVSNIYLIKEDTTVVFEKDGYRKEALAKAGDIVVCFYEDKFPNKVIIVNNQEWKENIEAYDNYMQEQKEKWASEKCQSECNTQTIN